MKRIMLIGAAVFAIQPAFSADDPSDKRFSVAVGAFWPDVNTTVRLDGNGGRIGTELDFESDLGLDDRDTLFTGELAYRIGKRHHVDLLYFRLARDGEKTLDIDVSWGDREFFRQETIDSFFDTDIIRLSYGYAFIDNDRHRLMGQIGVHYTQVSAGLKRENVAEVRVEGKTDVPLPVIGLNYDYEFSDKVSLNLRAQIFRLEFDEYDGSLDNLSAALHYAFSPRWSAFVAYNYYKIDLDAEADRWNGSFEFGYHGPWLGVTAGFGSSP